MPKFSQTSLNRINECHPDLRIIAHELIKLMDVTILCGHRSKKDQNKAYNQGNSQLTWPRSKHNQVPSLAIDIAPYPIDWQDIERFKQMCYYIEAIANFYYIDIRLGRDFSFKDYPHLEIL